jgi:peptidyl-prolyl cis-trans isomerase A (cyclophilin A)
MTTFTSVSWRLACAGLLAATLSACGGGGIDGGSLSSISATSIAYGRNMSVTVSGQQLESTNYIKAEGCENATASSGGSGSSRTYTCTIRKVGPMTVRVHNQKGDVLGSVDVEVPTPQVRFNTRLGNIVVELDPTRAPVTVNNFLAYVGTASASSFYTNTIFHRVIQDFVVQAGGFTTGPTPKAPTRAPIVLESNNGLKNLRGTIAMARTGAANSATSQFYINVQDNPSLDYKSDIQPGYAVFGRVVDGLGVVDAIQAERTTSKADSTGAVLDDVPVTDVVITGTLQIR